MNKEDIAYTLRLTAMGRLNTPHQDEFCDKLARLFATLPAEPEPEVTNAAAVTRTVELPVVDQKKRAKA
jgi:hypothetical protein